ncbi:MAG: helix-turn-helix domain-containing protein [bacterium]
MELPLADKLYSSTEVCDILGVSLRTLYRYIESGDLGSIQTPTGRHRFTKKHMEEFLGKGKRVVEPVIKESEDNVETVEETLKEETLEKKTDDVVEEEEDTKEEPEELSLSEESDEPKEMGLGQEELVEEAEEINEIYYKAGDLDVRSLAKRIKEVAEEHNLKYAFTGLGGLSLHYPIKPFSNLEVYIEQDLLDLWIRELVLVESSKISANLKVNFNNEALSSAESLGGLMVASKVVLADDLRNSGYEELAEELKNRM